jgi:hypothetical protein
MVLNSLVQELKLRENQLKLLDFEQEAMEDYYVTDK